MYEFYSYSTISSHRFLRKTAAKVINHFLIPNFSQYYFFNSTKNVNQIWGCKYKTDFHLFNIYLKIFIQIILLHFISTPYKFILF